jgi:hypothetical protein
VNHISLVKLFNLILVVVTNSITCLLLHREVNKIHLCNIWLLVLEAPSKCTRFQKSGKWCIFPSQFQIRFTESGIYFVLMAVALRSSCSSILHFFRSLQKLSHVSYLLCGENTRRIRIHDFLVKIRCPDVKTKYHHFHLSFNKITISYMYISAGPRIYPSFISTTTKTTIQLWKNPPSISAKCIWFFRE